MHSIRVWTVRAWGGHRSFVSGEGETDDPPVAKAMVDLGQTLGLCVVTEGQENQEQVTRLLELGCRWGQGYHYSRPQAASELDELLKRDGVQGLCTPRAA